MRRRIGASLVILAMGAGAASFLEGAAMVVAWELAMVTAIVGLAGGAWPERLREVPSLSGGRGDLLSRPRRVLASLELEIAGATDPRLTGERPLRRRLRGLLEHRAGSGAIPPEEGRRLLGERAWRNLVEVDGTMSLEEIEELVDRIEAI